MDSTERISKLEQRILIIKGQYSKATKSLRVLVGKIMIGEIKKVEQPHSTKQKN